MGLRLVVVPRIGLVLVLALVSGCTLLIGGTAAVVSSASRPKWPQYTPPPPRAPIVAPVSNDHQVPILTTQARTAATNRDCAMVRAISDEVARRDPAYYAAAFLEDPAIMQCMPERRSWQENTQQPRYDARSDAPIYVGLVVGFFIDLAVIYSMKGKGFLD